MLFSSLHATLLQQMSPPSPTPKVMNPDSKDSRPRNTLYQQRVIHIHCPPETRGVLKLREGTRKKKPWYKFETPFLQLGWISDKFDGSLVSNSLDPRRVSLIQGGSRCSCAAYTGRCQFRSIHY